MCRIQSHLSSVKPSISSSSSSSMSSSLSRQSRPYPLRTLNGGEVVHVRQTAHLRHSEGRVREGQTEADLTERYVRKTILFSFLL